ncbi:hypothetical protein EDB92DRAFT_1094846 [Lactarius akahatsu]|uniref:Uncharacterized protein n=1 Tax=Lactarius akahatsu TaxID=416441 RepID=A0AAD4LBH0_9AGAM|nr:hypothetical protein EDB92DRAFT_1094846 [Lactarius akahatsu]
MMVQPFPRWLRCFLTVADFSHHPQVVVISMPLHRSLWFQPVVSRQRSLACGDNQIIIFFFRCDDLLRTRLAGYRMSRTASAPGGGRSLTSAVIWPLLNYSRGGVLAFLVSRRRCGDAVLGALTGHIALHFLIYLPSTSCEQPIAETLYCPKGTTVSRCDHARIASASWAYWRLFLEDSYIFAARDCHGRGIRLTCSGPTVRSPGWCHRTFLSF